MAIERVGVPVAASATGARIAANAARKTAERAISIRIQFSIRFKASSISRFQASCKRE